MRLSRKEHIADNFGAAAPRYEEAALLQKQVAANLSKHLPALEGGADILEIGCGTGLMTRYLLRRYPRAHLHVTDISPSMLAAARENITSASVKWGILDGENPPANLPAYDLIISSMVFQWFEDIDGALEKLGKHLKPTGAILFALPGPHSGAQWQSILQELGYPSGLLEFTAPPGIIAEEIIKRPYAGAHAFLTHMKDLGAHEPKASYRPLNPGHLRTAMRRFDRQGYKDVDWHILYGALKKEEIIKA
ncbi:MAG: methyltransferase [Alphaproteobacteria bacterium]|nr:methyltransferase [Alphaproteobacteria bacterium]